MTNQNRTLTEDDFDREPATEAGALAAQLHEARAQVHNLQQQVLTLQQSLLDAEKAKLEASNKKLRDSYGFDNNTILRMDADSGTYFWLKLKKPGQKSAEESVEESKE